MTLDAVTKAILSHKDAIEIGVWAIGLFAVVGTLRQVSIASKQKAITESFELSGRISTLLSNWSSNAQCNPKNITDIGQALAALLGGLEITSDGINRGYLSKMSREILSHQILDSLDVIVTDDDTRTAFPNICHNERVCSALKIFLLKHWRQVSQLENGKLVISTLFTPRDIGIFSNSFPANIERTAKTVAIRFSSQF